MLFGGPAEFTDQGACFPPHASHEASAVRGFRVAVGVVWEDLLKDKALNLVECAAGRDIVGVHQVFLPVGPHDFRRRSHKPVPEVGGHVGFSQTLAEL